jgi:hypothetical protein
MPSNETGIINDASVFFLWLKRKLVPRTWEGVGLILMGNGQLDGALSTSTRNQTQASHVCLKIMPSSAHSPRQQSLHQLSSSCMSKQKTSTIYIVLELAGES